MLKNIYMQIKYCKEIYYMLLYYKEIILNNKEIKKLYEIILCYKILFVMYKMSLII